MEWKAEHGPAYTLLKVWLEPGEAVVAEPGAMVLYRGDVEIRTSSGGVLQGLLRAVAASEHFFLNTYVARSRAELWFAPEMPGDISYIPLKGGSWVVQDTSYLAHHGDVSVSIAWRGLKGLLAEGELIWLKVSGHGGVWVSSYGALDKVELGPGERAVIDNFHFVAMPASVRWRVRKFGGWKSFFFGGEGLVFEVEGPATVLLQTRVLPPLARELRKYLKK
ncbi:MAG: TIGR00266 family protein [Thermoprotei archaeon]|nr:MAG: TIGR00266 family protein [Thermoprotei archaeon]